MSNPGFRITTIHAIIGIEPETDDEGVPGFLTKIGPIPLIAGDERRLSEITTMAQHIADTTGNTLKIVRFSVREDIGEVKPRGKAN